MDLLNQEIEATRDLFNLEELLKLQNKHKLEVVRGDDWLFYCVIDGAVYSTSLTPMYALVHGVMMYKKHHTTLNNARI